MNDSRDNGVTEGQMDGQTDGQTDKPKVIGPPARRGSKKGLHHSVI